MRWLFDHFGTPVRTTYGHIFAVYVAGQIVVVVAFLLAGVIP